MKNSSRRTFVKNSLGIAAGALIFNQSKAMDFLAKDSATAVKFDFVKLPYAFNALEPSIDAETMQIHYERHYSAYVKNANEAIQEEGIKAANPKALFAEISKYSKKIRNNGGGAFNHEMFWSILQKPTPNNAPKGKLLATIVKDFGSLDAFKEQFAKAATGQFGSGWAWLVSDAGKLKIGSTPNQDNPLMDVSTFKGTPLLCLDVWEHAYYLKYQNKRADYIKSWWDIVNWDQVSSRFGA